MSQYIDNKKFIWGLVLKQHQVNNEYLIIEYVEKGTDNVSFHPYLLNTKTNLWLDTHHSFNSFDEALLGCLEFKYLGYNDNFTQYAYRILDIGKKYENKDNN